MRSIIKRLIREIVTTNNDEVNCGYGGRVDSEFYRDFGETGVEAQVSAWISTDERMAVKAAILERIDYR